MSDSDTVKLLRECNSGIQMAVFSIDEILEKALEMVRTGEYDPAAEK